MNEYTPSTDEVRRYFSFPWSPEMYTQAERFDAFNRWLNKIKAEAWEQGFKANFESSSTRTIATNPYRTDDR